jgi:hypothetical protein
VVIVGLLVWALWLVLGLVLGSFKWACWTKQNRGGTGSRNGNRECDDVQGGGAVAPTAPARRSFARTAVPASVIEGEGTGRERGR